MPNTKISALPVVTTPVPATDAILLVQAGADMTVTPSVLFGVGYSLFPLGGANGGIIIRQTGGVAGTNETRITNTGLKTQIVVPGATNGTPVFSVRSRLNDRDMLMVQDNSTTFVGPMQLGNDQGSGFASTVYAMFTPTEIRFSSPVQIGWNNQAIGISVASDACLSRAAAAVLRTTDASGTTPGWLQNTAGEACLATAFTKANATLGATNLSFTVVAGRSYRIEGILQVSNSVAGEGVQLAFDGGACSATTFFVAATAVGTNAPGTVVSTTLAGTLTYTSVTGTNYVFIRGFLKANLGGTLILRAAENTTTTGTLTIGAGSWLALRDTVPL